MWVRNRQPRRECVVLVFTFDAWETNSIERRVVYRLLDATQTGDFKVDTLGAAVICLRLVTWDVYTVLPESDTLLQHVMAHTDTVHPPGSWYLVRLPIILGTGGDATIERWMQVRVAHSGLAHTCLCCGGTFRDKIALFLHLLPLYAHGRVAGTPRVIELANALPW